MTTDTSENLYNQVYDFMQVPIRLAESIIELSKMECSTYQMKHQRDRFFTNVFVSQSKGIIWLCYCSGEYYATRKMDKALLNYYLRCLNRLAYQVLLDQC